jgi:hypothetical protein
MEVLAMARNVVLALASFSAAFGLYLGANSLVLGWLLAVVSAGIFAMSLNPASSLAGKIVKWVIAAVLIFIFVILIPAYLFISVMANR